MKFNDIRQFPHANYTVNVGWEYLDSWLGRQRVETLLDLDPDFQRGYVWNEKQKIDYIEYQLKGGFSGRDIFWNCSSWMREFNTPLQIVDGKQRIRAVQDFLEDKVKAFGYYYNQYEDKLISLRPDFIMHVNNLQTRLEVLEWYLGLNSGGTIHTEKDLKKVKVMILKEKLKERSKSG
jgi:hypothetical protein